MALNPVGKTAYNTNLFIKIDAAKKNYGISDSDIKLINTNKDEYIQLSELKNFGFGKYTGLTEYFNKKTNGALAASLKPEKSSGTNSGSASLKDNFTNNYNSGQLSPTISSDAAYSHVGNVFPRFYA